MSLFGKSFEEKVQDAVAAVAGKVRGVRALTAKVDGKVVTLAGEADSMETKAAVMREFNALVETGNTLNTVRVAAAPAPAPAPAAAPPGASAPAARTHVVVKGDTLGHIAQQYYGKASLYPKIFEANRDVLSDPNKISPGQKLRIPE